MQIIVKQIVLFVFCINESQLNFWVGRSQRSKKPDPKKSEKIHFYCTRLGVFLNSDFEYLVLNKFIMY